MPEPIVKPNYPGFPEKSLIRHLRNVILELKKTIQSTKDANELELKMEHFLNANRKVIWPHQTSDIYRKDEAEKAVSKVISEFKRYVNDLQQRKLQVSHEDLVEAILIVETLLDRLQETL